MEAAGELTQLARRQGELVGGREVRARGAGPVEPRQAGATEAASPALLRAVWSCARGGRLVTRGDDPRP